MMMRLYLIMMAMLFSSVVAADTMDHYMNIATQIPKMEMKADPQSQSWARSARDVLAVTNESVAETLVETNEQAKGQGRPLFCLPAGVVLNGAAISKILQETYQSMPGAEKDKMTVSQLAWLGVSRAYPCQANNSQNAPGMKSVSAQ